MAFWLLAAATVLLALSTLTALLRHEGWWVRMNDFPRLQLSALAGALLVLELLLLDWSAASTWLLFATGLVCLLYQIWWILPYTRLVSPEVLAAGQSSPDDRIRLINVNLLTPNRHSRRLLEIIRDNDPDIIIALEADDWWQARLDELGPDYPYSLKCPLDNLYGMLVYSRLRLSDTELQFLVEDQVPSAHALVTLASGARLQLHALHPAPPSPTENEESSERDAELVIVGRVAAEASYPTIVTGDLNDVAWSATTRLFRKVSGLLDPRVGRGMFNTFHAGHWFLRWPLDHVFHSRDFTLVQLRRLPGFGSDHFPILVELALEPKHGAHQDGPDPDTGDQQWASAKAASEDVGKQDVHRPGE